MLARRGCTSCSPPPAAIAVSSPAVAGLAPNYGLLYNSNKTELDALHLAQIGAIRVTPSNPTVITGGTTALIVSSSICGPFHSRIR